jgi:hypothetical protein
VSSDQWEKLRNGWRKKEDQDTDILGLLSSQCEWLDGWRPLED